MITAVKKLPSDDFESILEIKAVYGDMDVSIRRKMIARRSYDSREGTNGKIEIMGDFVFIEHNGFLQLDEHSRHDADDALAVFKAICGASEEGGA